MGITGVILAGGESRRMGGNKALLPLNSEPILAHVIRALQPVVESLLLVTNTPEIYSSFKLEMASDLRPGFGALGGIYTALKTINSHQALIVACDMPLLSCRVLARMTRLARSYDVLVPHDGQHYEPLCAVYGQSCLPAIELVMDADRRRVDLIYEHLSVRRFERAEWQDLLPDGYPFLNVNTPEDYALARQYIGVQDDARQ